MYFRHAPHWRRTIRDTSIPASPVGAPLAGESGAPAAMAVRCAPRPGRKHRPHRCRGPAGAGTARRTCIGQPSRSRRRVSWWESPAARSTTGSPVARSSTCGRPAVPCGSSSIHCGAIRMPASPGRIRTEPGKTSQHPQRSERRAAPAAGTAAARLTRALVWRAPASRDRGFRTVRPQAGAGSVVQRCGRGWSAVADAPSAPRPRRGPRPLTQIVAGAPWQTRRPPPREPSLLRRPLLQVATGPPFYVTPYHFTRAHWRRSRTPGSPLDSPARRLRPPVIPPSSAARSLLTEMFAQYAL